ncbi:hypothetical protein [Aquimarina sp. 2201CG14-23]|uniref:hypothetical protein n=1 Tax=Aquimarina mycalae TaxID=3040073 RepID=UPI002478030C|nr:hypothetical protein [Aquimarina sp. 2201CG14-23]MDH7447674.1 hypothetical protein [Aquimarina sp. 2201CG14-23]
MITISGMKLLTKNELKSINAGGLNSCIRRHQRLIIRTQRTEPFDEGIREEIINGLVEDAKKCYDGTNVL